MPRARDRARAHETRRELIGLLIAGVSCAVVLTVSLASEEPLSPLGLKVSGILVAALVTGGLAMAFATSVAAIAKSRAKAGQIAGEASELRQRLTLAEAMMKAEPQVLVYWQKGDGLRVAVHSLDTVAGLPADPGELLRFGTWLDRASAETLKTSLDLLFAEGRAFNSFLRTHAGDHVEADGRAAGARAILRLRDVAGARSDLVRILEMHRQLSADIATSRGLVEALPMPAWIRGADKRLTWVNQAYAAAVEARDAVEVIAGQIELLDPRQRLAVGSEIASGGAFRRREPLNIAGQRKTHDVIAVPVNGTIAAVAIDVDDLESAQGELDRQMTATDRTLDRVTTAVAVFDRAQALTFYNEAYRRLWELDPGWLDRQPSDGDILDRLREQGKLPAVADYRRWKESLIGIYKRGEEHSDWWQLPGGRMLRVNAVPRPDGGVTYLYDDATERLALESAYKTLIHVQRETLDSLGEGVAVFSTDGRLQLSNSAFRRIWQLAGPWLDREPHVADVIARMADLHGDATVWHRLQHAVTSITDERDGFDGQMVRADHTVIDYAAMPLPDGGTLLTFADVTASKRYERALIERNEALVAADKVKSRFISSVSYELRTPLNTIIGFSQLLENPLIGPLNDKQREYLADISASSQTLLAIIDDILDLATIDAGVLELKLERVRISDVIDTAIGVLHERASRARLTLDIALADDVDTLVADPERMRQIVFNLLSNAVGFSNPGDTIRISCWREVATAQAPAAVVLEIADEGIGIPEESLERVFDRFVSEARGSRHRGAGLGLPIVRSLVELHQGTLELASKPGAGTTVTVRLPESGPVMESAADEPAEALASPAAARIGA
ncbi:MAG: PAS-domain containing protein [Hyphomicrobiaceae bacterium]